MRLFHGTKTRFNEFSFSGDGRHGQGIYLATSFNDAAMFAKTLFGNGGKDSPMVMTVETGPLRLLNTMDEEACKEVCQFHQIQYSNPKKIGQYGNMEYYDHLVKILKASGYRPSQVNFLIHQAGFDGLYYAFCEHVIVFDPKNLDITSIDLI